MKRFIKASAIFLLLVIPTLTHAQNYHTYDTDQNWVIEDFELLDAIDVWAVGNLGDFELLDLIDFWADICYHWEASTGKYEPANLCGDSFVQPGEDCDGGGVDTAACDVDCSAPTCGDNQINTAAGEQCDDGNTTPGDGCDASCQAEATSNLTLTSISVLDADDNPITQDPQCIAACNNDLQCIAQCLPVPLYVGHPVKIIVGIESDTYVEDVAVNFFIVDKAQFDNSVNNCIDPKDAGLDQYQYFVGGISLDYVHARIDEYPRPTVDAECAKGNPEDADNLIACGADENCLVSYCGMDPNDWTIPVDPDCGLTCGGLKPAEITVPYFDVIDIEGNSGDLIPEGDYYLFAQIDPADDIPESDEKDNMPWLDMSACQTTGSNSSTIAQAGTNFNQTMLISQISHKYKSTPRIVLEDLILDVDMSAVDPEFLFDEPPPPAFCAGHDPEPSNPFDRLVHNVKNTHLGITAILNSSGSYFPDDIPLPISGVAIEATLEWTYDPTPEIGPICYLGQCLSDDKTVTFPVQIWNPDPDPDNPSEIFQSYINKLSVFDLQPGVPTSVHADLRIETEGLKPEAQALKDHLRTLPEQCIPGCGSPPPDKDLIEHYSECYSRIMNTSFTIEVAECFYRGLGEGSVDITVTAYDNSCEYPCGFDLCGWSSCNIKNCKVPCGTPLEQADLPGFRIPVHPPLDINIIPFNPRYADSDTFVESACPTCSEGKRFEAGFEKDFSNSASEDIVSARLKLDASAELNKEGASADATAYARASLFGNPFMILGLDAEGRVNPEITATHFSLDLYSDLWLVDPMRNDNPDFENPDHTPHERLIYAKYMDCQGGGDPWNIVDTDICPQACTSKMNECIDCVNDPSGPLCADNECTDLTCCEDNWTECDDVCVAKNEVKSTGLKTSEDWTFVLVGVPVIVSFEASATVGFTAAVELPVCQGGESLSLFRAYAGPYLNVNTVLSGGVGFELGSIGVEADADLINDTFYARAEVDDLSYSNGVISGTLREDITNTLTGPEGGAYLYAKYICGASWCGWDSPCAKYCKEREELFNFETFEKKDVLFCNEDILSVNLN